MVVPPLNLGCPRRGLLVPRARQLGLEPLPAKPPHPKLLKPAVQAKGQSLSFWGAGNSFLANHFPLGRLKLQGHALGLPLSCSQVVTCPQHLPPVWKNAVMGAGSWVDSSSGKGETPGNPRPRRPP